MIGDDFADAKQVKRVLLCTGKVYYDLLQYQQEHKRNDVAIVRLEQLYPFPMTQLEETLKQYGHAPMVWYRKNHEWRCLVLYSQYPGRQRYHPY